MREPGGINRPRNKPSVIHSPRPENIGRMDKGSLLRSALGSRSILPRTATHSPPTLALGPNFRLPNTVTQSRSTGPSTSASPSTVTISRPTLPVILAFPSTVTISRATDPDIVELPNTVTNSRLTLPRTSEDPNTATASRTASSSRTFKPLPTLTRSATSFGAEAISSRAAGVSVVVAGSFVSPLAASCARAAVGQTGADATTAASRRASNAREGSRGSVACGFLMRFSSRPGDTGRFPRPRRSGRQPAAGSQLRSKSSAHA